MIIRDATAADAEACAAIYAPYVTETCISFELDPPDEVEMARRIASSQRMHGWLVAEQDGRVIGYAYGSTHSARAAYRFTADVSVYLDLDTRGSGTGRLLYDELLALLADRGIRMVCAGVTLPNERSERFHRSTGFEPVGIYRKIGWKFGAWHDVLWLQKEIGDQSDPRVEPR